MNEHANHESGDMRSEEDEERCHCEAVSVDRLLYATGEQREGEEEEER